MASSCVVFPTLTTTSVSTSQSLVTTSTHSISTGPSSVSTSVFRTCSQDPKVSSSCPVTITTSFITFPGNTTTVTVPATLTVDVPVTVSTTLFGSSCSSTSTSSSVSSTSSTPTSTSPTSTSTSTSSTTATSSSVITTPSLTVITTNSLVTSDASTSTSFTSTSTYPAITANDQSTGTPSDKRISPGPIVGGVIGGLAALLLLGLLTWRLVKKESKFGHFFNHDEDDYSGSHPKDPLLVKPSYQYGMVGQPSSNPVTLSLPDMSPAFQNIWGNDGSTGQAAGPHDAGLSQSTTGAVGNDGGLGQASGQVSGNEGGLGQASGQVFGNDAGLGQAADPLGTDGGLGQTVSGGHGTVGNISPIDQIICDPSLIPLIVGVGTAVAASSAYAAAATSSRPSSSRPSTASSSQPLGPLVTPAKPQEGYPPALQNWNDNQGYGQAHAGPSGPTTLPHGSRATSPSLYSHASWTGNSSTNYNAGDGGGGAPILPSMGAAIHSSHHPRNSFGRVPSLRVTNNTDYEYHHPYAEIGPLSTSTGSGPSSQQQQMPAYDGKGRPLNILPEKAPLVHLDGALYQQPPRGGPRPEETAPPVYFE